MPDFFLGTTYETRLKIYQINTIYTQWLKNIPNDRKICQHNPFQALQNIPKLGFFGMQIYACAIWQPWSGGTLVEI
jgi:hypothetical protein